MNVNGKEINLTPTEGMREEAQRYRDWKADGKAGGTEVAARRATQILSGDELSVDTVREMNAWFARHEVDKQGEGFTADEDGYPSKGRVAWAAWGGDPGQSWSKMKAESITDAQDRSLRAGPDDLKVGDFVRWDSSGGTARGRITRVAKSGSIDVPDSSFTINADEDDPAALITRQLQIFEAHIRHVRATPCGDEHVREALLVDLAIRVLPRDHDRVAVLSVLAHRGDLGAHREVHLLGERLERHIAHGIVRDERDAIVDVEDAHAGAKPRERLPELEANHASADHGE